MLTLIAIAFAAAVVEFFVGIQLNSYSAAINATVSMFAGHLQIQREGFNAKPQLRNAFVPDKIIEIIRSSPNISAHSPRALGFALASSEQRSIGIQVVGVDALSEPTVSTIPSRVNRGRYLDGTANTIVVGSGVAKRLDVDLGSEITVLGQGIDGSLAAGVLEIVGIFDSGSRELDSNLGQISLDTFNDVFSAQGQVHSIVIKVHTLDLVQPFIQEVIDPIKDLPIKLDLLSWEDLLPGLKESIELDMTAGWLFFLSLILIVSFGIMNTFLMSVLERTKEFGVMLAIGTSPIRIARLIATEAFVLTAVGIAFGIVVGSALIAYFGRYGFSIPGTEEIIKMWNLPAVIYPKLSFAVLTLPPAVVATAAFLSVLYPILKSRKIDPATAVRT